MKLPSPEILRLRSVSVIRSHSTFGGDSPVLKDVNFSMNKGEHWVLLGPNGSGKSTLLSTLQGFLWPCEGSLTCLGRTFGSDDITEMRKHIGWVGNDTEARFHPGETAGSIVLSGTVGTLGMLFEKPGPQQKRKVREIMNSLGITHLRDKPFGKISQGERRIICIARALMTHPEILMLDEACAGLDPVARELFLQRLEKLCRRASAPSLLFATHHIEEIRPFLTHGLLMKNGGVLASGPLKNILRSESLSEAFGQPVTVSQSRGRYQLRLAR